MTIDQGWERPRHLGRRALLRGLCALGAAAAPLAGQRSGAWGAAKPAPAPPPPPGYPPTKQVPGGVTLPSTDPHITAGAVQYAAEGGETMQGYLSVPVGGEVYPGILLVHDFLGLTEHMQDVTRRLAYNGYVTLAPDLLSRVGGTAKQGGIAQVQRALQNIRPMELFTDLNTSVRYLEAQPLVSKIRIGVLGFGFGANIAWYLMGGNVDIKAAVLFDAATPDPQVATTLHAAVLAIYGDADTTDSDGVKDLDAAMKTAGDEWQYKIEAKAERGFFDDSRTLYAADAAQDAWKMTLDWFSKHLSS